jgi:hypothetical protein
MILDNFTLVYRAQQARDDAMTARAVNMQRGVNQ